MPVQLRWADLDPNFHLRHSVYYDWGALCRVECFRHLGLTTQFMQENHIGPILFREECVFRKEIRDGDRISIDLGLVKARRDYSRWTMRHQVVRNEDTISAVITVDGAWIDTMKRKLGVLPETAFGRFSQLPRDADFQWLDQ